MPLNPQDEMGGGALCRLAALNCFNDGILWAAGRDPEAIAWDPDCLMMTGVDGKPEEKVLFRGLGRRYKGPKERLWGHRRRMGDRDTTASSVIHWKDGQILNKSASTPDIEELDPKADREDRFIQVVGILNEKLIDTFAKTVSGGALGNGLLAVLVRIHIGWTTR